MNENVSILINQAFDYIKTQKYHEAIRLLKQLIKIDPKSFSINYGLGLAFGHIKKHQDAREYFAKAIKIDKRNYYALFNMACALSELGKNNEAIYYHKLALQIEPFNAEAWISYGKSLYLLGSLEESLFSYKQALKISPTSPEIFLNIGLVLAKQDKHQEAINAYDEALKIREDFIEVLFNKSNSMIELLKEEEAIKILEKILKIDSKHANSLANKGILLNKFSKYTQSIDYFLGAININQELKEAHSGLGESMLYLNRNHEALIAFDKAIEIDPSFSSAYLNKAFSYLVMGEFKKGWLFYEYRWKTKDPAAYLHPQLPQLKTLKGISDKCILVWAEQGLGDTLQFSRYISLLQDRGADIIFEVQPSLFGLFSSQEWCSVIARGNPFRKPDYQTPLLSLPLLFETDLASIPSCNTVLKTNADRVAKFHKTLSLGKDRLNIGLACSGNSEHKNDRNRTMPLHHIAPLLPLANVFLIQKEVRASDLEFLGDHPEIHFMGAELYDFEDTAAVVQNMDLIISVDTSLAHLAGSLGKKLLVLLPWAPEWRWLLNRQDSPWYPSATLLRQPSMGDWGAVIEKVREFAKNIVIEK